MFAAEALRLGYSLCCPLPFAQAEYERDFAPPEALEADSVARFHDLLDEARRGAGLTVFELDGQRTSDEAKGEAYAAAGRVVLNQSDLMVAVWDGGEAAGAGGTVDTLHDAIRFHVPVLWIDAVAPFGWMVVRTEADIALAPGASRHVPVHVPAAEEESEALALVQALARIVVDEVTLPAARGAPAPIAAGHKAPMDPHQEAAIHASNYFAERRPAFNLHVVWKLFRGLVGDFRLFIPRIRTTDFIAQVAPSWPTSEDATPAMTASGTRLGSAIRWVNSVLRGHFAWSDKLADLYADAYRSAFLSSYLLAAMAVLIALLPTAAGWAQTRPAVEIACIVGEFAMLSAIVGLLMVGRSRRWHERWMEYRVLAELLRELRFLIPLGGGRPLPRTPTHLAVYGDPAQTWMYWHLRAIARATGIPNAAAAGPYLAECLDSLIAIADDPADGQKPFHQANARRFEHLHERLHRAAFWLFMLTIVGIALHLAPRVGFVGPVGRLMDSRKEWLILASALLPALGAALTSIDNHGEFVRIAKRSQAMSAGLGRFADQLRALREALERGDRVSLAEVTPLAGAMAETMVDENIDWRVVVQDRPQTAA